MKSMYVARIEVLIDLMVLIVRFKSIIGKEFHKHTILLKKCRTWFVGAYIVMN